MKRPRVLLADDDTLVLEGFRRLLEPQFEVVGMVEDGRALLTAAEKLQPDVILLDISMPLLNGVEAARHLRKSHLQAKLIFLTMHANPAYVNEAFRAGASAYLLKRSAASELVFAIEEALQGRFYVTSKVTQGVLDSFLGSSNQTYSKTFSGKLTPRQREVLQLVAEGHSTKEIASTLNIAIRTVEFHKTSIMRQLGLRTTAGLTRYAVAEGIVSV